MIHLIAAVDRSRGIGRDNDLLCHISADLKRFKALTMNHTMLMGRKTFESLPGMLPGRPHYVLTRQDGYGANREGLHVFGSIPDLQAYMDNQKDYFVIGGASIYEAFLPLADSMYLTEIDEAFPADAFFPAWQRQEWYAAETQAVPASSHNKYAYRFVRYIRKKQ